MIFWKDFIIDEVIGAHLFLDEKVCNDGESLSPLSVMEDADGRQIQETGQEQRPARMAGLSSSDLDRSGKEAGEEAKRSKSLRWRGA